MTQDSHGGAAQEGDLRVWWIPQMPMEAFYVPVESLAQAKWLLSVLADYDAFQFENCIKPDYCNAGGLQVHEDGSWLEWMDPETGDDIDSWDPAARPSDTAELERLAASITPGEWVAEEKDGPQSEWQRANIGVWSIEKFHDSDAAEHGDDPMDDAWLCGIWGSISDEDKANARAIALVPALIREVLARRKAEAWRPISSAPFHTPVIVQVGQMTFPAVLRGNAAMDENGQDCAQWQAMNEGEHPPCWSDGACWASNADGLTSMQPTGWKPATPEAEGGQHDRA